MTNATQIEHLTTANARLEAERDQWKAKALELRDYANHAPVCRSNGSLFGKKPTTCDCGLVEALATLDKLTK